MQVKELIKQSRTAFGGTDRGAAKGYSITTRRRDLDSDIRNADVKF